MATPISGDDDVESAETMILSVDDDPQIGDLIKDSLEHIDDQLRVVLETAPPGALDRLETEPIDCIISDFQMPEMNGIEFLRDVREDYPNLPFILFTGKGSEEVASEAINAGVTDYVQKGGPEVYELLVNQIQNAVDRRRSERLAKIASDRLLRLYEQTDGFFVLDSGWTITYWNRTMAQRTGRPSEEVVGEHFLDAFPEAAETELYEQYRRGMEFEESSEFETFYDPHGYWVSIQVHPVDDGLFVHSRETTAERERELELERRNHILESFANTVSHDLRNPLNVAQGKLQLAKQTGDFDHLEEVAQAHNRMRNLIDELLRLARGEELALSAVSLNDIATKAWETVSAKPTELHVDEDLEFEAHETQLRRLFENLFWNAVDHGEAETIRVGPIESEGFFIEDDGTGIPEGDRERVFESGVSTEDDSPGYGLSIVRGIVDTHGWDVRIDEGRDGGARFEISGVLVV